MSKKISIIGDLINSAYGRARKAWKNKDLKAYQNLAISQVEWGSDFLDVNIDRTKSGDVKLEEMLEFLPEMIPALQEATSVPLCFDNPSPDFQQIALESYDFDKSGAPIINSIAASRQQLDRFLDLINEYKPYVLIVASEILLPDGDTKQCESADEVYKSSKYFVDLVREKADIPNDKIILDPGLPPVSADTQGIVNMGLDAMKLIRADKDLEGVHISVGLSNFSWGTPKHMRSDFERAYLSIASKYGLDMAIANPEHNPVPLPEGHPFIGLLDNALKQGRPHDGMGQSETGYLQAEAILSIVNEENEDDDF
ncbi:MAG TPA: dihydropteroate synthase [Bacteroidetes bacterium]|nr:dihydropteroate synthase [Bacteroidota bacterium]